MSRIDSNEAPDRQIEKAKPSNGYTTHKTVTETIIPVLDLTGALSRLGDDRGLYADMVEYFLEDSPRLFSEIEDALSANDASEVRMKAHALKGLISACGGMRAQAATQSVEEAGHSGNLRHAATHVRALQQELSALTDAVQPHRR